MSNNKLLNYQNINIDKYEYLEPVKSNNCYLSSCVYNLDGTNRLPYYFQTPRLYTPTGIYKIRNEYKMDVVIPVDSPFLEYLINEDDKNIQITSENSQEWFDEHFTTNEVSDKYKTSLIFRQGGEDPILRVNIPSYRGKPTCEVFDVKGKECSWNTVQPESQLIGIIEKVGIKFYKEILTGEYELHKIKVYNHAEQSKLPKGYMFQDDDSQDELDDEHDEHDDEHVKDGDDTEQNNDDEQYILDDELDDDDTDDDNLDDDDTDDDDTDDDILDDLDLDDLDLEELVTDNEDETEQNNEDDHETEQNNEDETEQNNEDETEQNNEDEDEELEGLDIGLEELDLTDNEIDDSDDDQYEYKELERLEDELEELDLTNNEEDVEVNNKINLSNNIESIDSLDLELNNIEQQEEQQEEQEQEQEQQYDIEQQDENNENHGMEDLEQDFEGGHDEELHEMSNSLQIDELTDDELELNLTDDESDIEQDTNEQTYHNELDDMDLSDLEETDITNEIQRDISNKTSHMIEPEELTDDELELNL